MIKAIMLVCSPVSAWDRVALDREALAKLIAIFLAPLLVISVAVQMAGWVHLGRYGFGPTPVKLPISQGINFGLIQLGINFLVVLICAQCIKGVAKTFHRRNTFSQAFCLTAHSLAPYFMVCMLDAIPDISPWATFFIAISLSMSTLYYGVPRILEPDPPSAFGIYFVSAILMFGIAGLARLIFFISVVGKPHFHSLP